MINNKWRIWEKNDKVESRTYQRVTGELPEMESTKQLVKLVSQVYEPGMKILDVGCAAGHYYKGLVRINREIEYMGIDSTVPYIEFAKDYFKDNPKAIFRVADIFDLPDEIGVFDIVFCCNVILHLPDFRIPIMNLLKATKRVCIIRTLISVHTHLCKFLYTDEYDENGNPTNFVYQNTYSYKLIKDYINSLGDYSVELIEDNYNVENINKEFVDFHKSQSAVTKVIGKHQVAGSKIFEWKWLKILAGNH